MKYISDNEIACRSFEDAMKITEVLMRNNYVCMLSQEEGLTIINYEWDEYCNRNGMIFRNREDWEYEQEKEMTEEENNDIDDKDYEKLDYEKYKDYEKLGACYYD